MCLPSEQSIVAEWLSLPAWSMSIQFSRRLAILYGITLPILETLRRWQQLSNLSVWPFWLDDWLIAAMLLYGAWRTRSSFADGQASLAAAWGFTCAMGYMSFFSQLTTVDQPDPSGLSPTAVVAIKGSGLALAAFCLLQTLRWKPTHSI